MIRLHQFISDFKYSIILPCQFDNGQLCLEVGPKDRSSLFSALVLIQKWQIVCFIMSSNFLVDGVWYCIWNLSMSLKVLEKQIRSKRLFLDDVNRPVVAVLAAAVVNSRLLLFLLLEHVAVTAMVGLWRRICAVIFAPTTLNMPRSTLRYHATRSAKLSNIYEYLFENVLLTF